MQTCRADQAPRLSSDSAAATTAQTRSPHCTAPEPGVGELYLAATIIRLAANLLCVASIDQHIDADCVYGPGRRESNVTALVMVWYQHEARCGGKCVTSFSTQSVEFGCSAWRNPLAITLSVRCERDFGPTASDVRQPNSRRTIAQYAALWRADSRRAHGMAAGPRRTCE